MQRAALVSCCVFAAACRFELPEPGIGEKLDGPPGDTASDEAVHSDGPADARLCYGAGLGMVCLSAAPTQSRMLSGTIDTGNSASCDEVINAGGTSSCVIAGTTVTISTGATVRATGTRPLVIVSAGQLLVDGTLTVGSLQGGGTGAGAGQSSATCGASAAAENDSGGGGGGAGGSFIGRGGEGGEGDINNSGPPTGSGAGGGSAVAFTPTSLRAGCPGANGGSGGNAGDVGVGGAGGGAVYLISGIRIEISGVVSAAGAGGGGGDEQSGGGGGGSGGMLAFDAPVVAVSGRVAANGGGGGEGGGIAGPRGDSGDSGSTDASRAAGGVASAGDGGNADGGNGGLGSGGGTLPGANGQNDTGGGGGGGGGAGFIYVKGILQSSGTVSPAATVTP